MKRTETKTVHIRDLFAAYSIALFTSRSDYRQVIALLTGKPANRCSLPMAAACKPYLLIQHPFLGMLKYPKRMGGETKSGFSKRVSRWIEQQGKRLSALDYIDQSHQALLEPLSTIECRRAMSKRNIKLIVEQQYQLEL